MNVKLNLAETGKIEWDLVHVDTLKKSILRSMDRFIPLYKDIKNVQGLSHDETSIPTNVPPMSSGSGGCVYTCGRNINGVKTGCSGQHKHLNAVRCEDDNDKDSKNCR